MEYRIREEKYLHKSAFFAEYWVELYNEWFTLLNIGFDNIEDPKFCIDTYNKAWSGCNEVPNQHIHDYRPK